MTAQLLQRSTLRSDALMARGREVVQIELNALEKLAKSLEQSFADACEAMAGAAGRVVITGMGKSGLIARKWAATLAATGTPALFIHPAEAAHGDLGMLVGTDVLVVISNSGNTSELAAILRYARKIGVSIIGIASRPDSLVMQQADIRILLPEAVEACRSNVAPTASTTMQLALGDALALAVMDIRGFSRDSMKDLHPGGSLGLRLTPVSELMHRGARMPLVEETSAMEEVIVTMTSRSFGIAGVTDKADRLVGVITDGDLRRHFHELSHARAQEVMTREPKTLPADALAEDALNFLNESKITCAFVLDREAHVNTGVPIGIIHIHDFLRIGLG